MKLVIIARNRKDQPVAAVLADDEDLARAFFQGASVVFDHLDVIYPSDPALPKVSTILKTETMSFDDPVTYRRQDYVVVTK